ncbi:MAG TPA: hypothetical protein VF427_13565 [Noviherbaspirillum sp.]
MGLARQSHGAHALDRIHQKTFPFIGVVVDLIGNRSYPQMKNQHSRSFLLSGQKKPSDTASSSVPQLEEDIEKMKKIKSANIRKSANSSPSLIVENQ